MVDRERLVAELNQDLTLEFQSLVQYVQHIATARGAEWTSTIDELEVHVHQELEHALTLARQIAFLGEVPRTDVPDVPPRDGTESALRADLELEQRQLERYRERVEQASDLGLPDVSEAITPLLQQTQEHVRDLVAALEG